MRRTAKRERGESSSAGGRDAERDDAERLRTVKRGKSRGERVDSAQESQGGGTDRRFLRSQYLALINKINDARDDLSRADSDGFTRIFSEVESLYQQVQKPREQVADAEALLDIANTLVSSVKSHSVNGITPAEFVSSLVSEFGQSSRRLDSEENGLISINWKDIGLAVSPTFRICQGCSTMLGPMKTELKPRKVVQRKRTKPTGEKSHPEEVDNDQEEEKTDTDKNMAIMFNILRRKKRVKLEHLILNRKSFAQTVENLFTLSFLVKDGRVEMTVDESGSHLVSPKNAPAASSVMSGEVAYGHFVFRFDFKDWKLMMDVVPSGEELMPHRASSGASSSKPNENNLYAPSSQPETCQEAQPSTPIRKLSRNRGLMVQDESVVEESPEIDDASKGAGMRRCKRRVK